MVSLSEKTQQISTANKPAGPLKDFIENYPNLELIILSASWLDSVFV